MMLRRVLLLGGNENAVAVAVAVCIPADDRRP